MVVRDFRSTFTTHIRNAGTDKTTGAKMQGHSSEMNDHYLEVTDQIAQQAILNLPTSYHQVPRGTTSAEQAPRAV